jgi:hypothetical protein
VPLDRILAADVHRPPLGRVLGYGTLRLAGGDGEVEFTGVPDVAGVCALLRAESAR